VASEETSEVWQTDGTTQGTVLIKEIIPGNPNLRVAKLATVRQDLYVIGSTGLKGQRKLVVYQVRAWAKITFTSLL
jgi:ELWxxDGT repeat protein